MKRAGFTSQIDSVGRLVIPKQIRNQFAIGERSSLEIFTTETEIILKKYQPTCAFCGTSDDITEFKNQAICKCCLNELKGFKE